MTGKLSTFERRIEILFFIISSKKVTLSELSKRYSVHKNTVYNDIAFLGRYAPIRAKSGVNGGIFLMEDYHNRVFRYLSYDEERVLTEIIDTLDQPEKNIVSNIINKFSMPKTAIYFFTKKARKITAVQYNGKQIHSGMDEPSGRYAKTIVFASTSSFFQ